MGSGLRGRSRIGAGKAADTVKSFLRGCAIPSLCLWNSSWTEYRTDAALRARSWLQAAQLCPSLPREEVGRTPLLLSEKEGVDCQISFPRHCVRPRRFSGHSMLTPLPQSLEGLENSVGWLAGQARPRRKSRAPWCVYYSNLRHLSIKRHHPLPRK
jgi:hypothetical protein